MSIFVFAQFNYITSKKCADLNPCLADTNCLARATESHTLQCDQHQDWFKSPNISLGYLNKPNFDYAKIELCDYDIKANKKIDISKIQITVLTIKSIDSTDTGMEAYYANVYNSDNSSSTCKFNIFAYHETKEGSLTLTNNHSSNADKIEIGSFGDDIEFSVRIEALPLDKIIIDNKMVDSNDCENNNETSTPFLRCLESSVQTKKVPKCHKKLDIVYTYAYDNEDIYKGKNLTKKQFEESFGVLFPPQVDTKNQTIELTETQTELELICKTECANPDVKSYTWYNINGTKISGSSEKLIMKISPDMRDDIINIYCVAHNDMESTDGQNRKDFRIIGPSAPRQTGGLEEYEIVIIVVCVFLAVLLLGGGLIGVFLFKKRNKNEKYKTKNETNNDINMDMSGRLSTLQKGLTDNPIYGSRQSCVTEHSI